MAPKTNLKSSTEQTPERVAALSRLLNRLDEEGRMDEVWSVLNRSSGTTEGPMNENEPAGTMSDASKRRRSPGTSVTSDGWEKVSDQQSFAASSGGCSSSIQDVIPPRVNLPKGIPDIHRWGQTLCELPKVAKKRMTYQELVAEAETNADLRSYLLKFVLRHNGPSPKVRDFREYLEAVRFGSSEPVLYYGSDISDVRRFKD